MDDNDMADLFVNPYYAITISPSLTTDHVPMVSKEEWVKANSRIIDELGKEEWLGRLLDVLEAGTEEESPDA